MKNYKPSRQFVLFVSAALLIAVAVAAYHITTSRGLSKADLDQKFSCQRMTDDVKETDIFCQNPKFYNNPDRITNRDYSNHLDCDNRLKNKPAESSKESDPGYYNAYYDCKDPKKLESKRLDFIKYLKEVKARS